MSLLAASLRWAEEPKISQNSPFLLIFTSRPITHTFRNRDCNWRGKHVQFNILIGISDWLFSNCSMTILVISYLFLFPKKCAFQVVCHSFTQMNWWFLMNISTVMFWQTQVSRFRWLRYMEARSGLSEWKQRRKYRLAHQKAITITDHDIIDIRTFTAPWLSRILSIRGCV